VAVLIWDAKPFWGLFLCSVPAHLTTGVRCVK